jgi:hypothetical protein
MEMILRRRGRPPGPTQTLRAERQKPEDAAPPVGGDDPRRWNGAESPVALTPPLMRRLEGNSAGAHLRPQKHPDPRRFRDGSQTPKIGFGDVHHTLRALIRPPRIFPHGGGATRGVGSRHRVRRKGCDAWG